MTITALVDIPSFLAIEVGQDYGYFLGTYLFALVDYRFRPRLVHFWVKHEIHTYSSICTVLFPSPRHSRTLWSNNQRGIRPEYVCCQLQRNCSWSWDWTAYCAVLFVSSAVSLPLGESDTISIRCTVSTLPDPNHCSGTLLAWIHGCLGKSTRIWPLISGIKVKISTPFFCLFFVAATAKLFNRTRQAFPWLILTAFWFMYQLIELPAAFLMF